MNRPLAYAALAGGILVVSTAAILVRAAQEQGVPSLVVAALRLTVATAVLLPIAAWRARTEWRLWHRRDVALTLLSGSCLAVHFGAWITSLEYTSVASSTALVTTNPIWVGIGSVFLLHERLSRAMIAGIAMAFLGTAVMFLAEGHPQSTESGNPMLGNALALAGALSASAYLLIGRTLRGRIGLMPYVSMAYGSAALILLMITALAGLPLQGHGSAAYLAIVAMALGPQLLGHTILNWSVRHMPATLVALSILGEPIGASLLAVVVLGEHIGAAQGLAFVLILSGIYLAARGSSTT